MKRTATCSCGGLSVECRGEPGQIFMCHCTECQRRTGTAFNLGAWFQATEVTTAGAETLYHRTGDQGSEWVLHFCPVCGTTVYWTLESLLPGQVGVAVGCFADPDFPAPTRSFFAARRHRWLTQPAGFPSHMGMLDTDLE